MSHPWLFKLLGVRGESKEVGVGRVQCLPSAGPGPGSSCSFPGRPGSFECDPRVTDKEAGALVRQAFSPVTQLLVKRGRTI